MKINTSLLTKACLALSYIYMLSFLISCGTCFFEGPHVKSISFTGLDNRFYLDGNYYNELPSDTIKHDSLRLEIVFIFEELSIPADSSSIVSGPLSSALACEPSVEYITESPVIRVDIYNLTKLNDSLQAGHNANGYLPTIDTATINQYPESYISLSFEKLPVPEKRYQFVIEAELENGTVLTDTTHSLYLY